MRIADELKSHIAVVRESMDHRLMKEMHYQSVNVMRSRAAKGQARRQSRV